MTKVSQSDCHIAGLILDRAQFPNDPARREFKISGSFMACLPNAGMAWNAFKKILLD